jgi:hypothetical protein
MTSRPLEKVRSALTPLPIVPMSDIIFLVWRFRRRRREPAGAVREERRRLHAEHGGNRISLAVDDELRLAAAGVDRGDCADVELAVARVDRDLVPEVGIGRGAKLVDAQLGIVCAMLLDCCSAVNCAICAINAVSSTGFIGSCVLNCVASSLRKSF